ncbi:family 20 glycosylhydrolase [Arcanobacterium phocae]|uniref:family 20 glycosylhydrolase n=1 Tax=Arcanobacterium phocae TaxID=131112 RepID=UPI001C0EF03A|nr:family 20 glycosylhydrolase [Arcanobacterium phocae]
MVTARCRWIPTTTVAIVSDLAVRHEAQRLAADLVKRGLATKLDDLPGAEFRIILQISSQSSSNLEAATIDVSETSIVVTASAPVGIFRATRHLLSLFDTDGSLSCGQIQMRPLVAERGLHIDAARKYFDAKWMKDRIREAASFGLNAIQWHFSENEGFRLESRAFPQIVSEHHITRDEAREILALARDLYVDIIPSLDMPGHLRKALSTFPELQLPPAHLAPGAQPLAIPDTGHALNIAHPEALDFARALIDDFAELFSDCHSWHLGGDEFVDFARISEYPLLAQTAQRQFGANANGFDLLTDFVNQISSHLKSHGFMPRVWNDGMLRGNIVQLDPEVVLTWWTNWHAEMRPVSDALAANYRIVNFNDSLFYYVLGENAGYRYPTAERIKAASWHPGLFPQLPSGVSASPIQEILPENGVYPNQLVGAFFSIWSDQPDAQTPAEVATGIHEPLAEFAARCWNIS